MNYIPTSGILVVRENMIALYGEIIILSTLSQLGHLWLKYNCVLTKIQSYSTVFSVNGANYARAAAFYIVMLGE